MAEIRQLQPVIPSWLQTQTLCTGHAINHAGCRGNLCFASLSECNEADRRYIRECVSCVAFASLLLKARAERSKFLRVALGSCCIQHTHAEAICCGHFPLGCHLFNQWLPDFCLETGSDYEWVKEYTQYSMCVRYFHVNAWIFREVFERWGRCFVCLCMLVCVSVCARLSICVPVCTCGSMFVIDDFCEVKNKDVLGQVIKLTS